MPDGIISNPEAVIGNVNNMPLQVDVALASIDGVGLTVIVNVLVAPSQPAADFGVTVMVAVIGALVELVAVKAGMAPVPPAAKPMAGLLLIHVLFAASTFVPENEITEVVTPAQKA